MCPTYEIFCQKLRCDVIERDSLQEKVLLGCGEFQDFGGVGKIHCLPNDVRTASDEILQLEHVSQTEQSFRLGDTIFPRGPGNPAYVDVLKKRN